MVNGPPAAPPLHGEELGLVDQLIPRLGNLQTTEDRYPGVVNHERRTLGREFPPADPDNKMPGMFNMDNGAAGGVSPLHQAQPHVISENIQNKIDSLRVVNQNERLVTNRPSGDININDLRQNPTLKSGVENIVEGFLRQ